MRRFARYWRLFGASLKRARDAFLIAWWRTSWRRKAWTLNGVALFFGLAVSAGISEVALRQAWLPWPVDLENRLFGCYGPDIYQSVRYEEPRIGVPLLKPGFATTCLANGYRWHHQGDRWGFRNPESWNQVEIVLMGDSFTYGNGVEEHQTMAHNLRDKLGVRVANLGITAGCPVHYLAYLQNFALRLEPRVVVIVFFANDLDDMSAIRSADELRGYLDDESVPETRLYDRDSFAATAPDLRGWTLERIARRSLSYQTLRFYLTPRPHVPAAPGFSDAEVPALPVARAYLRKALASMAKSSRDAGAALVLAYIPMRRSFAKGRNELLVDLLRDISRTNGLPFLDLTPVLADADGSPLPGVLLPRDEHLTPEGSERVAAAMSAFFSERSVVFRR